MAGWLAGWLAGPQIWLAGPQVWLVGPQAWLAGPQAWLDGQTKSPHSTGLCPLSSIQAAAQKGQTIYLFAKGVSLDQ